MAYLNRAITGTLRERAAKSKCLLVTGARQVGKSTLIKHVFPEYNRANFDDKLTRLQANEDSKLFFLNNPCPLFIDEVQKESAILEQIKLIVDETDERGKFILSGSQQPGLMKGMSESLAGRISIVSLSALSVREIKGIDYNCHFVPTDEYLTGREQHLKPYFDIWEIIHRGFYPEMYEFDSSGESNDQGSGFSGNDFLKSDYSKSRDWNDFYSSYVSTYLERDINELISADSITFAKFLTVVAARTAQMLNYANIADETGVSIPTVKKWISMLERTGIVYILQPFAPAPLNRAIKTPKIYFRDTGLACYLTRWLTADALKNSAMAGNMFETFAVSEIIKSFENEGRDYKFSLYYYRGRDSRAGEERSGNYTAKEREIDLIIEENGVLYPVEIKMSGSPKASMAAASAVLDKIPNRTRGTGVILCLTDRKTYLRENLIALPIGYV